LIKERTTLINKLGITVYKAKLTKGMVSFIVQTQDGVKDDKYKYLVFH